MKEKARIAGGRLFVSTIAGMGLTLLLNGCSQFNKSAKTEDEASATVSETAVPSAPAATIQETQQNDSNNVSLEGLHLVLVARYGHENVVRNQLDRGTNVDLRDELGFTPLIAAASENQVSVLELLIERGADVNAQATDGTTALIAASGKGYLDSAKLLIDAGIKVNAELPNGETALVEAVKYGHSAIVSLLLDNGADPNVQNRDDFRKNGKYTPLMYAAQHGIVNTPGDWLGIVNALITKGANPNLLRANGDSALSIAQRSGYGNIEQALTNAGARNETHYSGLSREEALIKAARLNDMTKVTVLLKGGAKPNYRNSNNGLTPLLTATYNGNNDIIQLLVKHGADVNHVPWGLREQRILSSSVSVKDRDLLRAAAHGDTALITAVRHGLTDTVRLLLESGADVDLFNRQQETPALIAARDGQAKIIALLLANGADPNITKIKDPVDPFVTMPGKEVTEKELLIEASINGHAETLRALLEAGSNPNIQDPQGRTALYWSAMQGHFNNAKVLFAHHADPNIADNVGRTSLMVAAKNGFAKIVQIHLENDSDVNAVENIDTQFGSTSEDSGMTALIYAARGGHADIVNMLLSHGADPNMRNNLGEMAINAARNNGYDDIAELLAGSMIN